MLALIAGTGDLPPALVARLAERPLICAMRGFDPAVRVDVTFRIEQLGSFLADLKSRGVTEICMAGAVRRPDIDPATIDDATAPLVPDLMAAIAKGDDGALRGVTAIFEQADFKVLGAHDVASDLLPETGVLTTAQISPALHEDAKLAEAILADMGRSDTGQACVIRQGQLLAREGQAGTDAMIAPFAASKNAQGAILFKGPKPDQDRRADLPVIGQDTANNVVKAGFSGIVIEAGGVMVLDLPAVLQKLEAAGLFLWVRPRGDA